MNPLYTEALPLHNITVIRKDNGAIERHLLFGRNVPDYFHCFSHQWTSIHISPVIREYTAGSIRKVSVDPISSIAISKEQKESAHILLNDETLVTCTETGVIHSVRIPSGIGTNLPSISPLASAENCIQLLKEASRHGQFPHQRFSRNVLAGMLISILRSKRLLRIKDAPIANAYLQSASGTILSSALQFSMGITSTIGLPSLSLLDPSISATNHYRDSAFLGNAGKSNADITILNWISAVKKAREGKAAPAERRERRSRTIKVYTDPAKQEAAVLKKNKSQANAHLENLRLKYEDKQKTTIIAIGFNVRTLTFLSSAKRIALATRIKNEWPHDADALALARIVSETKNEALDDDIFDKKVSSPSATASGKVDFMSILRAKNSERG